MPKYVDRDNILLQPNGSTQLHPATLFSEGDASRAILLLDQLGFDLLIFGWYENGLIREADRISQEQDPEV